MVLTVVHNIQICWVLGMFPPYVILQNIKSTRFGKRIFIRPRLKGWETPTSVTPLERVNLSPEESILRNRRSLQ
jgi:hypothetical protein